MSIVMVKTENENVYVNIKNSDLKEHSNIIVETDIGMEFGIINKTYNNLNRKSTNTCKFIRFASIKDINKNKKNRIDSQKALIKCRELIKKYKLNMKLFSAYYTFDRDKLIFKFTSEDRVDFRDLAKELANIYHTRIELKQVGVRDKAKDIGGCGQCGRELCCKGFLREFNSVSINMAKNQNISLNPSKINGCCGRLLCCLSYEDELYSELREELPKINDIIDVDGKKGKIIKVDLIKKQVSVMVDAEEKVVDFNDK